MHNSTITKTKNTEVEETRKGGKSGEKAGSKKAEVDVVKTSTTEEIRNDLLSWFAEVKVVESESRTPPQVRPEVWEKSRGTPGEGGGRNSAEAIKHLSLPTGSHKGSQEPTPPSGGGDPVIPKCLPLRPRRESRETHIVRLTMEAISGHPRSVEGAQMKTLDCQLS
ncbi:unnamed protein product [Nezara viridula]|uniref:Uncharacterized protein n=1 Tax=Nezara viridula TaxID=85310 RepID=A0A9P0H1P4_NEZVI|nr:unnamed protein product [Nezara viridula]